MIDKDGGGTLSTDEIVTAVKEDKDVIHFLKTCGEENLQFLLVPARLKKSLDYLDTDGSGELDVDEWEAAINRGLAKRLEQMADERARAARAAEKADAEFSADFLNAAREVFIMSARGVRPSTCARRGDGAGSAAILAVRRVWGRSYAIDATPYSPPDFHAASQLSSRTRKLSNF